MNSLLVFRSNFTCVRTDLKSLIRGQSLNLTLFPPFPLKYSFVPDTRAPCEDDQGCRSKQHLQTFLSPLHDANLQTKQIKALDAKKQRFHLKTHICSTRIGHTIKRVFTGHSVTLLHFLSSKVPWVSDTYYLVVMK